MRATLVAVQKGLKKADLDASVLEPVEDGYLIEFGNENLDGKITLTRQTKSLITVSVKVKSGVSREESVEQALVDTIRKNSEMVKRYEHFDFGRYKNIREEPKPLAKQVGWYLPGKHLEVQKSLKDSDWLRIKMPSGKTAYLKGSIAAFAGK
ncbi:SH3 domain-containing protein [Pseudomonadota bacterium]